MKFKAAFAAACVLGALLVSGNALAGKYYVGYQDSDMERTLYTTTTQQKNDSSSDQIQLGYEASENFSLEFMYGSNDESDESYYGLLLRPQTKLMDIGGADIYASAIMAKFGGEFFEGADDFAWGFGFEFAPSQVLSVTADWIHYSDDQQERLTGMNLGIKFRFGGEED